ncbi:MAG: prepilin-type N-terminal cleavage/methylation domain-containing protein [Planctomycetota bacterium]
MRTRVYARTWLRAFTLIELLVVILIIVVLLGIAITVGVRVLDTGRDQLTRSTITVVETILADFNAETDLRPRDYAFVSVPDPTANGTTVALPIIDARLDGTPAASTNEAQPSLGRFLRVVQQRVPGLSDRWTQQEASLVQTGNIGDDIRNIPGPELLDAWGNPLRFVHPSFDGGYGDYVGGSNRDPLTVSVDGEDEEFRRSFRPDSTAGSIGDADEGICPGGTPYIYSAGADGDPGTRFDNVYGDVQPTYPAETKGLDEEGA